MGNPKEHFDSVTASTTWAFTLISLALILVRLTWRYRRGQKFSKDDFWMVVSIAPLLLRLASSYIAVVFLTAHFNRAAISEDQMSAAEVRRRTIGSIAVLPGRVCYAGFLWCMKASILGWFEKVTAMEKPYAMLIRIAYVSLVISFVGVVLSTFLECQPLHLYWQVWPDPGECVAAKAQLVTMGLLNISTDLYLMAIPLPLVIRARLPLMRKVQLAMLFSVSLFVVSITIIRMPVIVGSGTMQQSRSLWASVEVLTACIVANAPVLNLFLHSLRHNSHRQQHQHQHHHHCPDDRSWQHQHGQQLPHSEASPASQRRRARMPVTGQDSFGSLTRNEGLDSPVCEPTALEITSISAKDCGSGTTGLEEKLSSPVWSKDLTASSSSRASSSPAGGGGGATAPPPEQHQASAAAAAAEMAVAGGTPSSPPPPAHAGPAPPPSANGYT